MTKAEPLWNIRNHVEHNVWPPLVAGDAAMLASVLHQFEASQWLTPEALQERQHHELGILAAYAYAHSPYFRQRMDGAGLKPADMQTPEGLRKLPLLSRRELQTVGAPLYCEPVPQTHLPLSEGKSSGSTGQPVSIKKTSVNRVLWDANMMREHFWHKRDFSGKIMNIRAKIDKLSIYRGWGSPVDSLYRCGDTMSVPITFSAQELVAAIQDFKPDNLIIYPNTLTAIITHCEREAMAMPPIAHIWSIGEPMKPELRARAETLFDAKIEDDYSCNEIGIMALQCPESSLLHVMSESVIIEILDAQGEPCKVGEVGRVVVTDLHNFATPMIRYDIGDHAEVGGTCTCGRGLPTIKAIRGRSRNLLVKPDGKRHWAPITLAVIRAGLPVRQFQVIQHSLEDVEARLLVDAPLNAQDEEKLREQLLMALDYPAPLRFTYFTDKIPLPPNGKFEDFICHVATL